MSEGCRKALTTYYMTKAPAREPYSFRLPTPNSYFLTPTSCKTTTFSTLTRNNTQSYMRTAQIMNNR